MEEFVEKYWPLALGLSMSFQLVKEYWRERTSRTWPTTPASCIEVPPDSRYEFSNSGLKFQIRFRDSSETDFAIRYSVDGREYTVRIDDLASFSIGNKPVSRTSGLPPKFDVRYLRGQPEKIYYRHAYSKTLARWLLLGGLAIVGSSIGYFIYTRVLHDYPVKTEATEPLRLTDMNQRSLNSCSAVAVTKDHIFVAASAGHFSAESDLSTQC